MLSPAYAGDNADRRSKKSSHEQSTQHPNEHAHSLHAHHAVALSLVEGPRPLLFPDTLTASMAAVALQLSLSAVNKASAAVAENGFVGCSIIDLKLKTMITDEVLTSLNLVERCI